jgi:stage V sporulation protein D (sporulation-specific penicillin-binding protein)
VFKRIAEQVLAYLDVAHDVPVNSDSEFAKKNQHAPVPDDSLEQDNLRARDRKTQQEQATFQNVVSKSMAGRENLGTTSSSPTVAFSEEDSVDVPDLTGQTVRSVTETCSRLGLIPDLIGSGVAVEQTPDPGTRVQRGSGVTVRFGRAAAMLTPAVAHVPVQGNVN